MYSSLEARLLLPIKTLAFGVPPHTFTDYFQMSKALAAEACKHFDNIISILYLKEYLRQPSSQDLKSINKLHKEVHGIEGMFASLDCMHTYWKNCPKAWAGQFQGKEKKPTIVLEAACDYNTWFWHASYGYSGSMNDIQVFDLSPLLESFVDGSFSNAEKEVGSFCIGGTYFDLMFLLVDGIYPKIARFVKACKMPITIDEEKFTAWQESKRKDIERAFGILQSQWQFIRNGILLMNLNMLSQRITSCIILHNICVSDRIMGDVYKRYDPSYSICDDNEINELRSNVEIENNDENVAVGVGISNMPRNIQLAFADLNRYGDLMNEHYFINLNKSLMKEICDNY